MFRLPAAAARRVVLGALVAVGGLLLAQPALPAPAAPIAAAHSQLVSSIPGAGESVAATPAEIQLVFSEAVAAGYTSFDLLDGTGSTVLLAAGTVDPADDHALVGAVPALADDTYTVNWRALSAADGHVTNGTYTFAVGTGAGAGASPEPGLAPQAADTLHAGHDSTQAAVEVQGKALAYGGIMIGFGLPIVARFVIRPATRRSPRMILIGPGVALLAAALGTGLLIVVGVATLPSAGGSAAPPDGGAFLTTTRPGQLLLARIVAAAFAGGLALVLARIGRAGAALACACAGGTLGVALIAISGHAAAFASPVPALVDAVHVAAGGIWLSGLVSLALLSDFGGRFDPPTMREVLPRFSALAIVSIGLSSAAGVYAWWAQTRDFLSSATAYSINLDVKVVLVLAALALGALNFLDAGRGIGWLGGLSRRLLLETLLAVGVVVVTANLTSGSPSAEGRPVAIAPAQATSQQSAIDFAVQPGRPGPNRFIAASGGTAAPPGSSITLRLTALNGAFGGGTRIPLRALTQPSGGIVYVADGGALAASTSYSAVVVVTDQQGTEVGRRDFAFAVDATGIGEGRALPPIDPGLAVGLLLAVGGLFGAAFGISGGSLPHAPAAWGRRVLVAGGGVGAALGALILAAGPLR
jgi:copper transport protein